MRRYFPRTAPTQILESAVPTDIEIRAIARTIGREDPRRRVVVPTVDQDIDILSEVQDARLIGCNGVVTRSGFGIATAERDVESIGVVSNLHDGRLGRPLAVGHRAD